jgi:hypothetical protein
MRAKQPRQPLRRRFLQHEQGFDIVQAMNTLFRRWFEGESDPWPVILKAAFRLRIASLIAVYAAMFLQAGAHGAA